MIVVSSGDTSAGSHQMERRRLTPMEEPMVGAAKENRASSHLRFQYSAQQRDSIATAAPSAFSEADWQALEQLAALCPSVVAVIPNKNLAAIERASKKLAGLLQTLSLAPNRYCVWSPEISALLKLIREQPFRPSAKGQRKSTLKRSNRARPDVLDNFLMRFVLFYASRGQHAGKDPDSPCVRFVIAAAAPVLHAAGFETNPGMISSLIRARAHTFNSLTAVSFKTGEPELGKPSLA
jgi:hypothetical protein